MHATGRWRERSKEYLGSKTDRTVNNDTNSFVLLSLAHSVPMWCAQWSKLSTLLSQAQLYPRGDPTLTQVFVESVTDTFFMIEEKQQWKPGNLKFTSVGCYGLSYFPMTTNLVGLVEDV